MNGTIRHCVEWASAASALSLAMAAAQAQEATPPVARQEGAATGIQDIIVTAQRRTQNVQKSSLAIQVLDQEVLQRAGATQASDLNALVPGVKISSVGSTVQVFIRGVGDITNNPLGNAAVAFNVDGVYVGRPSAIGPNFLDVTRIEVLKGPQGTLYGRNASGGAVNLITQAPKIGKVEGFGEVELGNYALKRVSGALNLPVGETFAVRGAFQVVDRDGYLSDGSSDQKSQSGRIRALWEPSSDVSILFNLDAAHVGGHGESKVLLPLVDRDNPWTSINSPAANAILTSYPFLPFPADTSRGVPRQDNDFINVSAQLDWNVGFATLTVLPAYRHTKEDYTVWEGFYYGQTNKADQTSLEARLSNDGSDLKWVLGGYYFDEDQATDAYVTTNSLFQNLRLLYDSTTRAWAAFGEATYSVTPRLRAIGGLRYTKEKKTLTGITTDQSPLTGPNRLTETYGPGDVTAKRVTWKAGAEFDLAPRSMLFATASTGFKAGGLNLSASPNSYRPEKLTAFTLGMRNRFLDNRLQINLEAFYWDYKDKQETSVALTPSGNISNLTRNAARARLKGGSIDIVATPSDNDTLRLFAEFNDAKYKNFVTDVPVFLFNPTGISTGCAIGSAPGVVRLDCSGFELVRAPRWTGSAGYDHRFDFANGASLTATVDAQFSSRYWLSSNFTPVERAPSYATFDASLTFKPAAPGLTITAFVRNITERAVYTGGNQTILQAPLFAASISAPRTFGGRIRYAF